MYARWLPVHTRDTPSLHETNLDIYVHFVNGNFTFRKSHHRFSAISIDQVHEQNNAFLKDEGGAIGLTENTAAFLRCNQEEAVSPIFLHVAYDENGGLKVLNHDYRHRCCCFGIFRCQNLSIQELWISIGTGIAAHTICNGLGNDKAKALLSFHCFTGCDTVSALHGKGEKSAWDTWKVYGEVTVAF